MRLVVPDKGHVARAAVTHPAAIQQSLHEVSQRVVLSSHGDLVKVLHVREGADAHVHVRGAVDIVHIRGWIGRGSDDGAVLAPLASSTRASAADSAPAALRHTVFVFVVSRPSGLLRRLLQASGGGVALDACGQPLDLVRQHPKRLLHQVRRAEPRLADDSELERGRFAVLVLDEISEAIQRRVLPSDPDALGLRDPFSRGIHLRFQRGLERHGVHLVAKVTCAHGGPARVLAAGAPPRARFEVDLLAIAVVVRARLQPREEDVVACDRTRGEHQLRHLFKLGARHVLHDEVRRRHVDDLVALVLLLEHELVLRGVVTRDPALLESQGHHRDPVPEELVVQDAGVLEELDPRVALGLGRRRIERDRDGRHVGHHHAPQRVHHAQVDADDIERGARRAGLHLAAALHRRDKRSEPTDCLATSRFGNSGGCRVRRAGRLFVHRSRCRCHPSSLTGGKRDVCFIW